MKEAGRAPTELGSFQWQVQRQEVGLKDRNGWFDFTAENILANMKKDRGQREVLKMKDLISKDYKMASPH